MLIGAMLTSKIHYFRAKFTVIYLNACWTKCFKPIKTRIQDFTSGEYLFKFMMEFKMINEDNIFTVSFAYSG